MILKRETAVSIPKKDKNKMTEPSEIVSGDWIDIEDILFESDDGVWTVTVSYAGRPAQRLTVEEAVAILSRAPRCRGCGKPLLIPKNLTICDGCPCNHPGGLNHNLVPKLTCTRDECFGDNEPLKAGAIELRYSRWPRV